MGKESLSLLQGTVDLIVLRVLAEGTAHGYGIAQRVREGTTGELELDDAALYQALHRLERQRLVEAHWAASENNRRARYYALTAAGGRRLRQRASQWRRYARALDLLLKGWS
jgi:transcriptional regulator